MKEKPEFCSKVYMKDILVAALDRMLPYFHAYEELNVQERMAKWHIEMAYELLTSDPMPELELQKHMRQQAVAKVLEALDGPEARKLHLPKKEDEEEEP